MNKIRENERHQAEYQRGIYISSPEIQEIGAIDADTVFYKIKELPNDA